MLEVKDEKKGIVITGNQLLIGLVLVAVVWFGGKWAVRAGVGYVRSQVRAEVVSVISDFTSGKIDLDKFKKENNGGKKLLPFASGDGIED